MADTWLEQCQELVRQVRVGQLLNELFYMGMNNLKKKKTQNIFIVFHVSCQTCRPGDVGLGGTTGGSGLGPQLSQ